MRVLYYCFTHMYIINNGRTHINQFQPFKWQCVVLTQIHGFFLFKMYRLRMFDFHISRWSLFCFHYWTITFILIRDRINCVSIKIVKLIWILSINHWTLLLKIKTWVCLKKLDSIDNDQHHIALNCNILAECPSLRGRLVIKMLNSCTSIKQLQTNH